ncbi:MAG: hypothetical protein IKO47_00380 [Ruminococcus sp.]|nr:hypothetical protein [Ruminococcus sp.]
MGDIGDILVIAALSALCVVSLFIAIRWLIYFVNEKEKAYIGSMSTLICCAISVTVFTILFFVNREIKWIYGLTALFELISFPASCFNILTPNGICRNFALKSKYVPNTDISYEYGDKDLEMYFPSSPKPAKYRLNIKSPKTVKMLADWYPKHDYKNPILPDENENEGE